MNETESDYRDIGFHNLKSYNLFYVTANKSDGIDSFGDNNLQMNRYLISKQINNYVIWLLITIMRFINRKKGLLSTAEIQRIPKNDVNIR